MAAVDDGTSLDTAEQLIAAAAEAGFDVTPVQLARWHRAGLLHYVDQHGRGPGGGKGTVSRYAPGSTIQVVAVARALAGDRSLDRVALDLWRKSYNIPTPSVRRQLTDIADAWDQGLAEVRDIVSNGPDELETWLNDPREIRKLTPLLRRVRKRVGSRRFPRLVRVLLELATSHEGELSPDDASQVERALAVDYGRRDRLPGLAPWLVGDTAELIRSLVRPIGTCSLRTLVDSLSDAELEDWRDESGDVLEVIRIASLFFNRVFGVNRFGLEGVRPGFDDASPSYYITISLLLLLVVRANPDLQEGVSAFRKLRGQAEQLERAIGFLDAVRRELPKLGDIVSLRATAAMVRYTVKTGNVPTIITKAVDRNRAEIDAVLQRHPELAKDNRGAKGESFDDVEK